MSTQVESAAIQSSENSKDGGLGNWKVLGVLEIVGTPESFRFGV